MTADDLEVIVRAFNAAANAAEEGQFDSRRSRVAATLREVAEAARETPDRLNEWGPAIEELLREITLGGVWPR